MFLLALIVFVILIIIMQAVHSVKIANMNKRMDRLELIRDKVFSIIGTDEIIKLKRQRMKESIDSMVQMHNEQKFKKDNQKVNKNLLYKD